MHVSQLGSLLVEFIKSNIVFTFLFLNSQTISSGELYEGTRQKRRTDIVRERKMRWYGDLMGMTENLPAKKSDGCIPATRNKET